MADPAGSGGSMGRGLGSMRPLPSQPAGPGSLGAPVQPIGAAPGAGFSPSQAPLGIMGESQAQAATAGAPIVAPPGQVPDAALGPAAQPIPGSFPSGSGPGGAVSPQPGPRPEAPMPMPAQQPSMPAGIPPPQPDRVGGAPVNGQPAGSTASPAADAEMAMQRRANMVPRPGRKPAPVSQVAPKPMA